VFAVVGQSAARVTTREPLSVGANLEQVRALGYVAPVAGALDVAHSRGLVHRDVKPANVLIAREPDADPRYSLTKVVASPFGRTVSFSTRLGRGGPIRQEMIVTSRGRILAVVPVPQSH
jgi:serine/threonine protein kinase